MNDYLLLNILLIVIHIGVCLFLIIISFCHNTTPLLMTNSQQLPFNFEV